MNVARLLPIAAAGVGLYLVLRRKKKRKTGGRTPAAELPKDACGLYPWLAADVDAAIVSVTDTGERDPEAIALSAARDVYASAPEGPPQSWPPHRDDLRALCILDRIKIRVNLHLAKLIDEEADEDDKVPSRPGRGDPKPPAKPNTGIAPLPQSCPPGKSWSFEEARCVGFEPTLPPLETPPTGPLPPTDPPEPPVEPKWPEYPPPAPVHLGRWTDPENYPTPGKFHQVGGDNSGTTLKKIARKALTVAFYLVLDDLDEADRLARRAENWRAYRQLINCCPWNHVMFATTNEPGTTGYYDTPHGESISLYPVHQDVAAALANGEQPERRIRDGNRKMPKGGKLPFIWLPPLDEVALAEGRVEAKREYWETGDWMVMPPPEVLTHGVWVDNAERTWGCDGWELEWYEENPVTRTRAGYRYAPIRRLRRRAS